MDVAPAAMLDVPGENSSDAAQLTTDLWIGGRSAAMDVLAANSRASRTNICEPCVRLGPIRKTSSMWALRPRTESPSPSCSDKHYGKIRSHVLAHEHEALSCSYTATSA